MIAVCHFADYYENVEMVVCVGYLGTGIGFRRSIFSFLSELTKVESSVKTAILLLSGLFYGTEMDFNLFSVND